jgi:hypothetical protein
LNIIEDARIERLIQKKYPGIKYQFKKGYMGLFNKNFFGTQDRKPDSYNLIDRLNIHFKVGGFGYYSVPFAIDEHQWIEKIDACDTFSDVVRTSNELFEYMRQQQESEPQSQSENFTPNEIKDSDKAESSQIAVKPESPESDNSTDSMPQSPSSSSSKDENEDSKIEHIKPNQLSSDDNADFESETQKKFDNNISESLVEKCNLYFNLKVPKLLFQEYIIDYKNIHTKLSQYYSDKKAAYGDTYVMTPDKIQKFKNSVTISITFKTIRLSYDSYYYDQ